LYFYVYANKPPFSDKEKRLDLLNRLNGIPGVTLPPDAISKYPSIALSTLQAEPVLDRFLKTFDWVLAEIKAA
jgi:hypothetical protein